MCRTSGRSIRAGMTSASGRPTCITSRRCYSASRGKRKRHRTSEGAANRSELHAGSERFTLRTDDPQIPLLLADELDAAAHLFRGRTVFPADAVHFQAIVIDDGQRRFVHVLVL